MAKSRYSAYRGRKPWGRRVLIGIAIVLAIVLVLAVVGFFVLRNYLVYTDRGAQIVLPFFRGETAAPTPVPPRQSLPPAEEDDFVVEAPSESPEPSATPTPEAADYEMLPRRTAPLGLRPLAEGEEPGARQGSIEAVTAVADLYERYGDMEAIRTRNLALPYAAAVVLCGGDPDPRDAEGEFRESLIEDCAALAAMGFDEIVLREQGAPEGGTAPGTAEMDGFYARLRAAMDELGYQGRLGVVCGYETFFNGVDAATGQSAQAVADHFDRVYVPGGGWGDFNLYRDLKDRGFRGTTADVVTVVKSPSGGSWAWAILPG